MSWVTKTTGVPALAARVEEVDDAALMGEVEGEQRLVGEDQHRIGDERLRDAQPLLLAAREPADWRVGVALAPTSASAARPVRGPRGEAPPKAPAVAVEPQPHEVAAAQRRCHGRRPAAAVRSRSVCIARAGAAVDCNGAGAGIEQAEQDPKRRTSFPSHSAQERREALPARDRS